MSFQQEYSNYLIHHGIKGMKWGVRKSVYKSLNRKQKKQLQKYQLNDLSISRNINYYKRMQNSKFSSQKAKDLYKNAEASLTLLQNKFRSKKKTELSKALNTKIKDLDNRPIMSFDNIISMMWQSPFGFNLRDEIVDARRIHKLKKEYNIK